MVNGREVAQLPEVEPDVLPVTLASDALVEEHAIGRELEVVRLVGERLAGVLLWAQVERHTFGPQVIDLLIDGELGLPRSNASIVTGHFPSCPYLHIVRPPSRQTAACRLRAQGFGTACSC